MAYLKEPDNLWSLYRKAQQEKAELQEENRTLREANRQLLSLVRQMEEVDRG